MLARAARTSLLLIVAVTAAVSGRAEQTPQPALHFDHAYTDLDGPWQFHLGDNPAWASPTIDDTTGHDSDVQVLG